MNVLRPSGPLRFALLLSLWCGAVSASASWTVSGVVADASGEPIAEATVWVVTESKIDTAHSGSDGSFAITGVPSADATVIAYRADHALDGIQVFLGRDRQFALTLRPAVTTPLRAVDPRVRGLAGARLAAIRINDRFDVPAERLGALGLPSVRSDEDGAFPIPLLAAGDVARIVISHRNYAPAILPTLPAGTAIDAVLPYGEAVRGRVVGPTGDGIEGALVSKLSQSAAQVEAKTGPDGFYRLRLAPGSHRLIARHGGYGRTPPVSVVVESHAETTAEDLRFERTTVVSGSAVDEDGDAFEGVSVRYIRDGEPYASTQSDSTGQFALRTPLGDGLLHFVPPAGRAVAGADVAEVNIDSDAPFALPNIRIVKLPPIRGRVAAPEGVSLNEVLVTTRGLQPNRFVRTGSGGEFAVELNRYPSGGALTLYAEHARRLYRGSARVDVLHDREPVIELEPFRPNLGPAADDYPNDLRDLAGKAAPELACDAWVNVDSAAAPPSIASLKGRIVVVTFWGGFDRSPPSIDRMRELERWHQLYEGDDSVAFVGVHEANLPAEELADAVRDAGLSFPVGKDALPFQSFERYRIQFIPQTVVIDRDGTLRHYDVDGRLGELIKDLRRR